MSRTVAEMVNKLTSTGKTITTSRNLALRAMSETAKTSVLNSARSVVPDLNLSGVGKKGARIGARYTIGATHAEVKATGPWQLIEYDTKPRVITPKGLGGSRRSRQAAVEAGKSLRIGAKGRRQFIGPLLPKATRLRLPDGGYRFYVKHPGTTGQNPWRHGVDRVVPQLPEVAAKVYRAQIYRIFR